ncbi:hypothetical protein D9611_002859 [Ephemerocybe angulata]|uniref:HMG box domain-containing protein n=1 Tax=Ephemerocybe angulata TaxID=980116 RepID=A0A8H5FH99_9AGAR|nr:hypothetical protein D9611_002859 [Tulosesus angulatus]
MPGTNLSSNSNENKNLNPGHSADADATPPIPPSSSNAAGNPTLFSDNTATNEIEQQSGSEIEAGPTSPSPSAEPKYPKLPLNPYFLFRKEFVAGIMELIKAQALKEDPTIRQAQLNQLVASKWNRLSDLEKAPYKAEAAEALAEYRKKYPDHPYFLGKALQAARKRAKDAAEAAALRERQPISLKSHRSANLKKSAKFAKSKGKGKEVGVERSRSPLDEESTSARVESWRYHVAAASTQNSFSYPSGSGSSTPNNQTASTSFVLGSGNFSNNAQPSTWGNLAQPAFIPQAPTGFNFAPQPMPHYPAQPMPHYPAQPMPHYPAQPMPHYPAQPYAFDPNYGLTWNLPGVNQGNAPGLGAHAGTNFFDTQAGPLVHFDNAPGPAAHVDGIFVDAGPFLYYIHGRHIPAVVGVSSSAEQYPQAGNQPTPFGLNAPRSFVSTWGANYYIAEQETMLASPLSAEFNNFLNWGS